MGMLVGVSAEVGAPLALKYRPTRRYAVAATAKTNWKDETICVTVYLINT